MAQTGVSRIENAEDVRVSTLKATWLVSAPN
jgi:hypothetical protein